MAAPLFPLARLWLALVLALAALLPPAALVAVPAAAQEAAPPTNIDYAAWEKLSAQAQDLLAQEKASDQALDSMRKQLADWRARFAEAQNINADQIQTVRDQIAALGPAPAEGQAEDPDIAKRRKALNDQLATLQAPGLKAVEARSLADGLIRQIDAQIRARQATELMRLFPSPANPANWPAGWAVLVQGGKTLGAEIEQEWDNPERRATLRNNLPAIAFFLFVAAILVLRGPAFMERLTTRVLDGTSLKGHAVVAALVSLGQFVVPVIGTLSLVAAVQASGMTGPRTSALIRALPEAAFVFFAARWLASWLFRDGAATLLGNATEARFHTVMIGLVFALEFFRRAFITEVRPPLSMAAQAVWSAPLVVLVAVFLFRLGLILRQGRRERDDRAGGDLLASLRRGLSMAVIGVSVLAPLLALVGYVAAANALIWPTVASLALIGLIQLLQRFATDIYVLLSKREDAREALGPVLIAIVLVLASLPVFALIWGARTSDLSEAWTRFSEGVAIGETRLSPGVLVTLLVVFALGYLLTRLVQRTLRSAILPRTRLEKGVQNALVSGIGYVGIFLAALIAITTAGINLSSLAIVAGALSVGIGFGLQNIVQNFVAGIILLIERPISEGDMIEVNGQFGTVRGISVRSTWIETFDRTDVIIPNADFISGVVTNLTRTNTTARLIVPVGVAYGSDTRKVQQILLEIAEAQPLVMVDPAPAVHFVALGADSLNFEVRAIISDVNFKLNVQTEMLHQITERFRQEGIEIPFAQRDIWVRNADELTGRRAAAAPQPAAPSPEAAAAPVDPARISNDPDADGDEQ